MPERVRSHDFNQIVCNVGGVAITGWSADGGVTFEMGGNAVDTEVGADGGVFANRTNDKRVTATISVQQGTAGAAYLGGLLRAQEAAIGEIPKLSFYLRNFISGEVVKSSEAFFIVRPTPNQENSASVREFQLMLPYAADKINWGVAA